MDTPSWEQRILDEIDTHADELIGLASDLIRTPSENPPGDCTDVARVIEEYLVDHGVPAEIHDAGEGRVNVLSHLRSEHPREDARHLVLSGHHDVVPVGDPSGWSFPPFSGDVVDGYLRGRGASDMKAGLAGVIFTHALLHRLGVPLAGDVSLASVCDEEAGGPLGADWVLEQGCCMGRPERSSPSQRSGPTPRSGRRGPTGSA